MAPAQEGILLLVHGEVTDPAIDFFDREKVFIERHLKPLLQKLPELKVRWRLHSAAVATSYATPTSSHNTTCCRDFIQACLCHQSLACHANQ